MTCVLLSHSEQRLVSGCIVSFSGYYRYALCPLLYFGQNLQFYPAKFPVLLIVGRYIAEGVARAQPLYQAIEALFYILLICFNAYAAGSVNIRLDDVGFAGNKNGLQHAVVRIGLRLRLCLIYAVKEQPAYDAARFEQLVRCKCQSGSNQPCPQKNIMLN